MGIELAPLVVLRKRAAGGLSFLGRMRRHPRTSVGAAVVLLLLAGLTAFQSTDRSCGSYELPLANPPLHRVEQQCLIEAFQTGSPADLRVRTRTIEGDPYRVVFRVVGPGSVLVLVNANDMGTHRREAHRCRVLAAGEGRPQHSNCVTLTLTS
jgi:hypothetical protein